MRESEEEQTADESADESAEPEPRTRERKLFLGGLRGGILGALISGLLAWGGIGQNSEWSTLLLAAVALIVMPFGFLVGAVVGVVATDLKLQK